MTAKVRVKVGHIEVDYEGEASFLPNGLLEMLEKISGMVKNIPVPPQPDGKPQVAQSGKLSTSTIASKLGVNAGSDLLYAAAAHLRLTKSQETFSRSELLEEMRGASAFFKESYGKNLSSYLDTLVKAGRLNSIGNQTFSLPESEQLDLGTKLA